MARLPLPYVPFLFPKLEPVGLVVAGAVSLCPAQAPAFLRKKMVTLDQARGV